MLNGHHPWPDAWEFTWMPHSNVRGDVDQNRSRSKWFQVQRVACRFPFEFWCYIYKFRIRLINSSKKIRQFPESLEIELGIGHFSNPTSPIVTSGWLSGLFEVDLWNMTSWVRTEKHGCWSPPPMYRYVMFQFLGQTPTWVMCWRKPCYRYTYSKAYNVVVVEYLYVV